jgi:hypothetical protein
MKNYSRYLLEIVVVFAWPRISRQVIVPADVKLHRLHEVIQKAVGTSLFDCDFFVVCGGSVYASSPWTQLVRIKAATHVRLDRLLHRPTDRLVYFCGDDEKWEHDISLLRVVREKLKHRSAIHFISSSLGTTPRLAHRSDFRLSAINEPFRSAEV